nr:hypothetical protein [Pseudomonas sp.]
MQGAKRRGRVVVAGLARLVLKAFDQLEDFQGREPAHVGIQQEQLVGGVFAGVADPHRTHVFIQQLLALSLKDLAGFAARPAGTGEHQDGRNVETIDNVSAHRCISFADSPERLPPLVSGVSRRSCFDVDSISTRGAVVNCWSNNL